MPISFSVSTDKTDWFKSVGTDATSDADRVGIGGKIEIGTTAQEMTGYIDEFQMYSSALTQEQINVIYNANSTNNFGVGTNEKADIIDGDGGDPIVYLNFDEKTGQTAYDRSGNIRNGTLGTSGGSEASDPTWTTGKFGSALNLDGNDDRVEISDFAPATNMTLEAWVYPTGDDTDDRVILSKNNSEYDFRIYALNGGLGCNSSGDGITDTSFDYYDAANINKWYHVVCVLDDTNNNARIYRNGVVGIEDAAWAGSITDQTNELWIGRHSQFDTGTFYGKIDEVKIFDYAMTPAQVSYTYNRGAPIGWWKFDECTGATAYNYALDGNDEAAGGNGTITPGDASGDNDTVGTCSSGTGTEMWNDGTTGKFNGSLGFDGTNDYVDLNSTLNNALEDKSFSITAWTKRSTPGSSDPIIINQGGGTTAETLWLYYFSDNTIQVDFGNDFETSTNTIADTNWHHVTLTYDHTTNARNVYVDAIPFISDTASADFTGNTEFHIGTLSSNWFGGQIDDVRFYSYPLSVNQIKKIMNGDSDTGSAVRFGP